MDHKRQGDLLFVRLTAATPAKPHPDGRVLAHGEATGHTHAVAEADLSACDVFLDADGRLVVEAKADVRVEHQEHGTVVLESGTWEVRRQREYAPEGWTRVAD
jgi:hypothetical protein